MINIVALDPGGTTGWIHWRPDSESVGGQLGPVKHHLELYELLENFNPTIIVCERFDYRSKKIKVVLTAREYIGVAELYQQTYPQTVDLVMQPVMKHPTAFWNDIKLKQLGLYTPGKPHRNDATRHLLHYRVEVLHDIELVHLLRQ